MNAGAFVAHVPRLGVRVRARVNGATVALERARETVAVGGPLQVDGLNLSTVVDGEAWDLVPTDQAWRTRKVVAVDGDEGVAGELRWLPNVFAVVVADDEVVAGPWVGARVVQTGRRMDLSGEGLSVSALLPESTRRCCGG